MTTAYVASRSARPERALDEGQLIEICFNGPNPRIDAESYARDETHNSEVQTYVYAVEISNPLLGFKIYKEVNAFVPSK